MIAAEQHVGHSQAAVFARTGVLRVFQQAGGKALVLAGFVAAQHAGNEPRHRVDDDQRAQLAAGEHIIADGNLLIDHQIDRPLIHALIVAAQKQQFAVSGQLLGHGLIERAAARGEIEPLSVKAVLRAGLDRVHDRLREHDHARPAAEGVIVGIFVLQLGKRANIDQLDLDQPLLDGAAQYARLQHGAQHLGEYGQHLNLH